jgi:hypothetical protein
MLSSSSLVQYLLAKHAYQAVISWPRRFTCKCKTMRYCLTGTNALANEVKRFHNIGNGVNLIKNSFVAKDAEKARVHISDKHFKSSLKFASEVDTTQVDNTLPTLQKCSCGQCCKTFDGRKLRLFIIS